MAIAIAIKTILRRVIQPSSGIAANRRPKVPFRRVNPVAQRAAGAGEFSAEHGARNVKTMACKRRIEGNSTLPVPIAADQAALPPLPMMIFYRNDRH